jgi:succinoglycan biosynthesis protein ExoA
VSSARFDVVVPAYNEAAHIDACLDAVFAQDYPSDLVHVYVVDAGSQDATADVVRRRPEPNLTLVTGRGRLNAAEAFNAGYREGGSPLIARVDAHTYLEPDYLSRAAEAFAAEGDRLGCVGGQPQQVGETRFGEAVALARGSRFGVGGSIYSDRRERAFVDTVQGGVYSRQALDAVGGFATDLLVGEDEEVNWRLKEAGFPILLDTSLRFRYTTRGTWRALLRQHRHYGQSRARVLARHPEMFSPRYLAPSALVGGLGVLALAAPFSGRARLALPLLLVAYTGGAVAAARGASKEDPRLRSHVAAAFSAMHLGYGIGLLEGAAHVVRARLGGGELESRVRNR